MDLFAPGPLFAMTGSLPKKNYPSYCLQSGEEQIWVFNKSVYVDCMGKQVAVQTVYTFGSTSQVTILCQLLFHQKGYIKFQLLLQSMSDCYKHNTPAALLTL